MKERKSLHQLTEEIQPVSPDTLKTFSAQRGVIIHSTVEASMKRIDEVSHHGPDAERILTSGMEFTLKMLESAMAFGDVSILEDEMTWALDRLPHDGVAPGQIASRLETLNGVIKRFMPQSQASQITPYIEWMRARIGTDT